MNALTSPADEFVPFPALIAAHAQAAPEAIAFAVDDGVMCWRTLDEHTRRIAQALVAAGIVPGDRVALLGAASCAYVECLFGIVAARACAVPLPVSASEQTLQALLADSGAKLLLVDPEAAGSLQAPAGLRVITLDGSFAQWRDAAPTVELPLAQADDAFNIIYSSGTTGAPKGIVHTHGMRQAQARRGGFGFSPEARTLLSTPTYSNTTIVPMLGTVANGGCSVLMRKFDAGRWLALAQQHRATHTMLVPVQYKRILAHPDFERTDLSNLQLSQSTGAPMDLALKQDILARWPGRFREVYGITEGGVSFFLDARDHPDKLGTVGKPGYGTEVFLLDEDGRRITQGTEGAVGEVVGRSPYMMTGYHNRPESTAQIRWLDEHGTVYHRTGDIGRFDADGFLTLLDRAKDVIISGGHNVYAADLEAVIAKHEDVQDATVIGVPSEAWGETPLALVVLRPGARTDAGALKDWVNAQVGKTQRLSAVELRTELPRSALGKLSKKELRAPYWAAAQQAKATT
jgi:acyl-CoA synthetase (AMP-forming)/AMP-acid ligase II